MVLYTVHGDRCSDRTGIVPFCNFGCVLQRKRDGSSRQSGLRICRLRTETGCIWQNSGGSDSGSASSDRRMCRRRNPASGKAVSELPGRETGTERCKFRKRCGLDADGAGGRIFSAGIPHVTVSGGPLYYAFVSVCGIAACFAIVSPWKKTDRDLRMERTDRGRHAGAVAHGGTGAAACGL